VRVPVEIDEVEVARRVLPLLEARLLGRGFLRRMARALAAEAGGEWMSVAEAARVAGVHRNTMAAMCRQGRVEAQMLNGRWRVLRGGLEK
jgi:excisionase family DNA binding protein